MKSMQQFINENNIRITNCKHTARGWDGTNYYKVQLKNSQNKVITTPYFMGSAHKDAPQVEDVLNCLALDSSSAENCSDLADFCSEFGYTEIQKANSIYKACQRQSTKVKRWLGEELYEELLWEVEGI